MPRCHHPTSLSITSVIVPSSAHCDGSRDGENVFSEEGFYMCSLKIIWFIYSRVFGSCFLKKFHEKWIPPHWIAYFSSLAQPCERCLFVYCSRMVENEKDSALSYPFNWKPLVLVWQRRKCGVVKYHLYKRRVASDCQEMLHVSITLARAIEVAWLSFC